MRYPTTLAIGKDWDHRLPVLEQFLFAVRLSSLSSNLYIVQHSKMRLFHHYKVRLAPLKVHLIFAILLPLCAILFPSAQLFLFCTHTFRSSLFLAFINLDNILEKQFIRILRSIPSRFSNRLALIVSPSLLENSYLINLQRILMTEKIHVLILLFSLVRELAIIDLYNQLPLYSLWEEWEELRLPTKRHEFEVCRPV